MGNLAARQGVTREMAVDSDLFMHLQRLNRAKASGIAHWQRAKRRSQLLAKRKAGGAKSKLLCRWLRQACFPLKHHPAREAPLKRVKQLVLCKTKKEIRLVSGFLHLRPLVDVEVLLHPEAVSKAKPNFGCMSLKLQRPSNW